MTQRWYIGLSSGGSLFGVDDAGMRCVLTTSERCRTFGIHLELETNRPIRAALAAHGLGHLATG